MKKMNKFYFACAACLAANAAWAADAISGEVQQCPLNVPAVVMFFIFVGATLFITKWAAKKNKSSKDFYTAGGGISGFQNGLAIDASRKKSYPICRINPLQICCTMCNRVSKHQTRHYGGFIMLCI